MGGVYVSGLGCVCVVVKTGWMDGCVVCLHHEPKEKGVKGQHRGGNEWVTAVAGVKRGVGGITWA